MPPIVARFDGRGVRAEAEAVAVRGAVEVLLHDAGPDAHAPRLRVEVADRVHVARGVEHDAARRRPSGPPGSCPPPRGDHRHAEAPGDRDRRRDVVGVAREGDRERLARVHARVAREQVAGVGVGAHVAAQLAPQRRGELPRRAPSPAPGPGLLADVDRQARSSLSPGVPGEPRIHSRAIARTLHAWASAADATSCRSPGRRTCPTASCGRSTRRRSTTAGPDFARARPRGARGPAARSSAPPARSSSTRRRARARGRPRSSTRSRPATACSPSRPATSRRCGARWPSGSGSRSSGCRATGATAPTPSAVGGGPRAPTATTHPRGHGRPQRDLDRRARAACPRSARRSTRPGTPRCCSSTRSPRSARSTTATTSGAST